MTAGERVRGFLWLLAVPLVVAAFVVLDWQPTVRELGRLRRERGDLERTIEEYRSAAAAFVFPDSEEGFLLSQSDSERRRSLPRTKNDDSWLALAESDLRQRERKLAAGIHVFHDAVAIGSGRPGWTAWLGPRAQEIERRLQAAAPWRSYPWRGILPLALFVPGAWKLACRPLAIALEAPLPETLGFINRVSWGVTRLEIIHLYSEFGGSLCRTWMICRGSYLVPELSSWLVREEKGESDLELLIDSDSPLLLRKVDPLIASAGERRELPADGSPW